MKLITVNHYQIHVTLMTLRRSLVQRSRSQTRRRYTRRFAIDCFLVSFVFVSFAHAVFVSTCTSVCVCVQVTTPTCSSWTRTTTTIQTPNCTWRSRLPVARRSPSAYWIHWWAPLVIKRIFGVFRAHAGNVSGGCKCRPISFTRNLTRSEETVWVQHNIEVRILH